MELPKLWYNIVAMELKEAREFITKNAETLNVSGIAKQLDMDVSNFHKVVNGDLGLNDERMKKLNSIIRKLCHKNTL